MENPEQMQTFTPKKEEYKTKYPYEYVFPDGTVGRYETEEERDKAVEDYKSGL